MEPKPPTIDPERLEELRQALAKLDPTGRKAWLLEVYALVDGADRIQTVIDLKTGQPVCPSQAARL